MQSRDETTRDPDNNHRHPPRDAERCDQRKGEDRHERKFDSDDRNLAATSAGTRGEVCGAERRSDAMRAAIPTDPFNTLAM